ncbi:MAG: lytic murein transglycosylase, partial [Vicinamibacterales bacterium]|nr:lytic murein transglycosylase [Vicinamibacterales bacterium]
KPAGSQSRPALARLAVFTVIALAALSAARPVAVAADAQPSFTEWLADVRREALERGYRADVVEQALAGLQPLDVITQRDRTQAEFTVDFDAYVSRWLHRRFVRLGRQRARPHREVLARVSARYGVPAGVVTAVWGVESNYGRFSGVRPVIASLATLAYDPRRAEFFRGELFDALAILDRGDIDLPRLRGSWAGAMGQPQFMPSSYLKYAIDFDGDGRRDIWGTPADVFASIANYLAEHGWRKGERWGREVRLPRTLEPGDVPLRVEGCRAVRQTTEPLPLATWRKLGVRLKAGGPLPAQGPAASLVRVNGRAFLVYRNYETLLAYNCAHHYALGVAMLSERLR